MKIGSLFSGYGGLDLAAESFFDARTVWHCEFEEAPSKVLASHWDVPNFGDITKVDWSAVEPVDILTGGFPCQDLSLAGGRAGLREGTRSGLWSHMAEAIKVLQPKVVVIENVRGLLSAGAHSDVEPCTWCLGDEPDQPALRALGAVLGDLADLGYDTRWYGLRAADVGASHNRFRVFILAYPQGGGRGLGHPNNFGETSGEVNAFSDSVEIQPAISLMPTPTVSDIYTGNLASTQQKPGSMHSVTLPQFVERLLPTPTVQDGKNNGGESQFGRNTLPLNTEVLLLPATTEIDWGKYAPAIERWEQAIDRSAPAPTEPSKKGKAQLSARFVEWMMGLPDGWVTGHGLTRNEELKMLGNGVVPQQAYRALQVMLSE